jgi:flagellar biosynthesis protein FlhG
MVAGPLRGSHYEVLGVEVHASAERVDRAYRFHLELYDEAGLATYSLLDSDELAAARVRVQEAYAVLSDPEQRLAYDRSLGAAREADGHQAPEAPPPVALAQGPAPPATPVRQRLAEPVTGAALRGFREARGVSLGEIAAASKVGVRFLEYIEQDRHSDLPAPVYLRGFVQEYARCVGLEPGITAEAYLARVPKGG